MAKKEVIEKLIIEDIEVGTGKTAEKGNKITVNYTGKFLDGDIFDSSVGRKPFVFFLGQGMVIKGWDEGFTGMKEGGKRTLKIPYTMAYGESGAGDVIPPFSDLVFDIELLKVG